MAKCELIGMMELSGMNMTLFLPLIAGHLHLGNLAKVAKLHSSAF